MTLPKRARRVRGRGAAPNQYIMEIDALEERVARLLAHMEEQLETWDRKPMVDALMALRGLSLRALRPRFAERGRQRLAVQVVTAMTLIAELGDLDRFIPSGFAVRLRIKKWAMRRRASSWATSASCPTRTANQ